MTDIQPATDEQITGWERLMIARDDDQIIHYFPGPNAIASLIARLRADAEKLAAAEANLTAMTNKAGDEFERAEAAEARATRLAEALKQLKDYFDLGEVLFYHSRRFGFAVALIDAALSASDAPISQTENSLMTTPPPSPRPFLLESAWSANELVTLIANALRAERRAAFERAIEVVKRQPTYDVNMIQELEAEMNK